MVRCRTGFFSTIFPGSTWEPGVKRDDENGDADADALLLVLMLMLMLVLMLMLMLMLMLKHIIDSHMDNYNH